MPDQRRIHLGKVVRDTWVKWARSQADPKPSWLLNWHEIDDGQREVDMRIGEAVAAYVLREAVPRMRDIVATEINPAKLLALADWLDKYNAAYGHDGTQMQDDLRRWARFLLGEDVRGGLTAALDRWEAGRD